MENKKREKLKWIHFDKGKEKEKRKNYFSKKNLL